MLGAFILNSGLYTRHLFEPGFFRGPAFNRENTVLLFLLFTLLWGACLSWLTSKTNMKPDCK